MKEYLLRKLFRILGYVRKAKAFKKFDSKFSKNRTMDRIRL
jgi:hypothetical protein